MEPAVTAEPPTRGAIAKRSFPPDLPLLTSDQVVIYPNMAAPLLVDDANSIQTIEQAQLAGHKVVALFAPVKPAEGTGTPAVKAPGKDLHPVGTAIQLVRAQKMPDGRMQLLVHGVKRIALERVLETGPYPKARVRELDDISEKGPREEAIARTVLGQFRKAVGLAPHVPKELLDALVQLPGRGQQSDFISTQLNIAFEERQELLGEVIVRRRFEMLNTLLNRELEILEIRQKIQSEAAGTMDAAQREYFLRQQLKAIREELGEGAGGKDLDELRERIQVAGLPEEARKEAERELSRMESTPSSSPEYAVSRTYLDWMVTLPWGASSQDNLDVDRAESVLNADHYGLDKPKERILEYLSVRKMKADMRGPILCFVGPPGVGKTSLGRSIASAIGRKFVRMSLGGVRDEAEIRGHRRTYVGALPGRVIQGLRRAGTNNPVFMLDEIDKLGSDFRGDPSSALLEVLDPEQNHTFVDHYLDVAFDLSRVLFIATANSLHTIPPALLDRMEVLEIPGYTESEKLEIAQRYLVPKQLAEHGLNAAKLHIDKAAVRALIQSYTREAGLRNLEREIGTLCRKVARKFARGRRRRVRIQEKDLPEFAGPPRYRFEVAEASHEVGVVAGLAWTPAGGDVLFVEATLMPGRGGWKLTGQVGDVMKESAEAATTYIRSRWEMLGLESGFSRKYDVHVHVPAGAVPKDGPSAGITMATVLASVFTRRPVRKDVAMTGEITLRGKVLPIGGVRDKVLAAHRAGISTVILPEDNRKDVLDIPESVRKSLKLHFVSHTDEVLDLALVKPHARRASGGAGADRAAGRRDPVALPTVN